MAFRIFQADLIADHHLPDTPAIAKSQRPENHRTVGAPRVTFPVIYPTDFVPIVNFIVIGIHSGWIREINVQLVIVGQVIAIGIPIGIGDNAGGIERKFIEWIGSQHVGPVVVDAVAIGVHSGHRVVERVESVFLAPRVRDTIAIRIIFLPATAGPIPQFHGGIDARKTQRQQVIEERGLVGRVECPNERVRIGVALHPVKTGMVVAEVVGVGGVREGAGQGGRADFVGGRIEGRICWRIQRQPGGKVNDPGNKQVVVVHQRPVGGRAPPRNIGIGAIVRASIQEIKPGRDNALACGIKQVVEAVEVLELGRGIGGEQWTLVRRDIGQTQLAGHVALHFCHGFGAVPNPNFIHPPLQEAVQVRGREDGSRLGPDPDRLAVDPADGIAVGGTDHERGIKCETGIDIQVQGIRRGPSVDGTLGGGNARAHFAVHIKKQFLLSAIVHPGEVLPPAGFQRVDALGDDILVLESVEARTRIGGQGASVGIDRQPEVAANAFRETHDIAIGNPDRAFDHDLEHTGGGIDGLDPRLDREFGQVVQAMQETAPRAGGGIAVEVQGTTARRRLRTQRVGAARTGLRMHKLGPVAKHVAVGVETFGVFEREQITGRCPARGAVVPSGRQQGQGAQIVVQVHEATLVAGVGDPGGRRVRMIVLGRGRIGLKRFLPVWQSILVRIGEGRARSIGGHADVKGGGHPRQDRRAQNHGVVHIQNAKHRIETVVDLPIVIHVVKIGVGQSGIRRGVAVVDGWDVEERHAVDLEVPIPCEGGPGEVGERIVATEGMARSPLGVAPVVNGSRQVLLIIDQSVPIVVAGGILDRAVHAVAQVQVLQIIDARTVRRNRFPVVGNAIAVGVDGGGIQSPASIAASVPFHGPAGIL